MRRELAVLMALDCEEVIQSSGLGVTRIAKLIGREKSQVSRTLSALAEIGFVDRDTLTLRYRLGWKLFALAARAGDQRLLTVASPLLEQLMKNLGETTYLSVLQGAEVLTVLSKPSSSRVIRAAEWTGRTVPVYCTASGRALLLDHDYDAIFGLLSGVKFHKFAPDTVCDVKELHEKIAGARAHGYVLVDGEFEPGLVAAAAPVRDFRGQIVAEIDVSAPKFRFDKRQLETVGQEIKSTADKLSALLGCSHDSRLNAAYRPEPLDEGKGSSASVLKDEEVV